jgi:U5 small nuclear ribonucleoprotein component
MIQSYLRTTLLWVQARYRVPISRAVAGNLVLVEGIDATITKTATVVPEALEQEMHIFR